MYNTDVLMADLQLFDELDDPRLHGDVERCCRFVGDQEIGVACKRLGDHDPLLHAAGQLVGITVHHVRGVRNLGVEQCRFDQLIRCSDDRVSLGAKSWQSEGQLLEASGAQSGLAAKNVVPNPASSRRDTGSLEDFFGAMNEEYLDQLIADRKRWVQSLAGSWKIMAIRFPRISPRRSRSTDTRSIVFGIAASVGRESTLRRKRGRTRNQLEEGAGGHALSAAGLADQSEDLAIVNVEVHTIDSVYDPGFGSESEPGDP